MHLDVIDNLKSRGVRHVVTLYITKLEEMIEWG